MIAVDTNVLVRLFVADDEVQAARVARLLRENPSIFVSKTVVLELVWVLEAVYRVKRENVLRVLEALAGLEVVELEDRAGIERAIELYRQGFEDFADALHLCSAVAAAEFVTFDKKLMSRARRLLKSPSVRAP
jgi:predicted nucleic-acid-binding protein